MRKLGTKSINCFHSAAKQETLHIEALTPSQPIASSPFNYFALFVIYLCLFSELANGKLKNYNCERRENSRQ